MCRKIVFLPSVYSKEIVDNINLYFDRGYEIDDILNADNGYYILLSKDNDNYDYSFASKFKLSDENCNLIEENQKWVKTTTNDVLLN